MAARRFPLWLRPLMPLGEESLPLEKVLDATAHQRVIDRGFDALEHAEPSAVQGIEPRKPLFLRAQAARESTAIDAGRV